MSLPQFTTRDIVAARPARQVLDPRVPYAFFVEPEHSATGTVDDVATLFLTNRECPFHCLMCDLWKHTLEETVPPGAIPEQIDYALSRLPAARHIKLYNSGNFFDPRAIPPGDFPDIARRVGAFQTVIVENHPRFVDERAVRFRDLIGTQLEVALGLETVHPEVLPRLNKQMTLEDFSRAVRFLHTEGISTRAFILLRPPFLTESEGIEWALKSIRYAFDLGIGCASVIPTRGGNGLMDQLQQQRLFQPPGLAALETVLEIALGWRSGRVFVDLWDAARFAVCEKCRTARIDRLRRMNLSQQPEPCVECDCAS